jgi:hypothetical protein
MFPEMEKNRCKRKESTDSVMNMDVVLTAEIILLNRGSRMRLSIE